MSNLFIGGPTFYHPSVCHTCKTVTATLKLCGRCKAVSYCSKQHQVENWSDHKDFCKAIARTDDILTLKVLNRGEERDLSSRIHYYQAIIAMLEAKLHRPITRIEAEIIKYRRSCLVCNCLSAPIECYNCLSVFYCSQEHKNFDKREHNKICNSIKLTFNLLVFRSMFGRNFHYPTFTDRPVNLKVLPKNLTALFKYLDREGCIVSKNDFAVEYLVTIDSFAPVANIVFGLEKAGLLQNCFLSKSSLVLHIVASAHIDEHANWCLIIEFLFHWIQNLKKLTCIVVGGGYTSWKYSLANMSSVCGSCNMNTTSFTCFAIPNYYHNVIEELEKPDLVAVFNTTIFEMLCWKSSIPCLVKYANVPLIMTDYSLHDLQKQLKDLKDTVLCGQIDIMLPPQRNPFSCIGPTRNNFKTDPVNYENGYVAIVRAK